MYKKGDDGTYACSIGFGGVEIPGAPFEYLKYGDPSVSGKPCEAYTTP